MKTSTLWIAAAIVPFGFIVLALIAAVSYLASKKAGVRVPVQVRR